jgi:hypothetical protein
MLKQVYSILLALVLATTSLLSAAAQPVSAAARAQQIYFSCASGVQGVSIADYVVIRGNNQHNRPVTWQGTASWANGKWATFVFARDWWWTGKVRIWWWNARANRWESGIYDLSAQTQGDVVYLDCRLLW